MKRTLFSATTSATAAAPWSAAWPATWLVAALLALLSMNGPQALAQTGAGAPTASPAANRAAEPAPTPAPTAKAEAEVRRVEVATGRVQLKHGPIPNLDMPPMTMVFRVGNPAWLQQLKEGDRILFTAEKINGAYTVTSLEVQAPR